MPLPHTLLSVILAEDTFEPLDQRSQRVAQGLRLKLSAPLVCIHRSLVALNLEPTSAFVRTARGGTLSWWRNTCHVFAFRHL